MADETEIKPKKPIWRKWWFWVIAIFVIIIIVAVISGNEEEGSQKQPAQQLTQQPTQQTQTQKSAQQPSEKEHQASWQKVKSWSGSGTKNTEPFEITSNQWRINWVNPTQDNLLQVMVYKTGSEIADTVAVNTMDKGSDSSYIYKKGSFYLSINATGKWKIEVEEYK